MSATEKPRPAQEPPPDLLPVIRNSGILTDRQFTDLKHRVQAGSYPTNSRDLARRLVQDGLLTEFQAGRLLGNRAQGLMVGRYVILDRLGAGSMGRVYKAHHPLMGRMVALKIIAPEIAQNERVVARFQREIKLVGRLDHPNVVRAFDADQAGAMLYIVMEYVKGASLGKILRTRGIVEPSQVTSYAAQAALGLAHAHKQGIVHRDVKPSNLFLSDDGKLKVLDLGLAALMEADDDATFATADGIAVGTVDYMSPEQATGREVDGRSDLFSLGCTLYHLACGKVPFPGDSPIDRLGKRITGRPEPLARVRPEMPEALSDLLDRLMATRPQDRFQTGDEAAEAFEALSRKPRRAPAPTPDRPSAPLAPESVEEDEDESLAYETGWPWWFATAAEWAEHSPGVLLALLIGGILATFGLGVLVGWLIP